MQKHESASIRVWSAEKTDSLMFFKSERKLLIRFLFVLEQ